MKPVFGVKNLAFARIDDFYILENIRMSIKSLKKNDDAENTRLNNLIKGANVYLPLLVDDINQAIYGLNQKAANAYFDELIENVKHNLMFTVDIEFLNKEIANYNIWVNTALQVEKDENRSIDISTKSKENPYKLKFWEKIEPIDIEKLPLYVSKLQEVLSSYSEAVTPYIKKYQEGKYEQPNNNKQSDITPVDQDVIAKKNPTSNRVPQKLIPNSFTFKNLDDKSHIIDFCTDLISHNKIHKETFCAQLKKIFSGKEVLNKVMWTGNINELFYFINELIIKEIIKPEPKTKWQIASKCFIDKNKKKILPASLSKTTKPQDTHDIDRIINRFLNRHQE